MFRLLAICLMVTFLPCAGLAGEKKPSDLDKKKAELTSSIQAYQENRVKECDAIQKEAQAKGRYIQQVIEVRRLNEGKSEIHIQNVPQD